MAKKNWTIIPGTENFYWEELVCGCGKCPLWPNVYLCHNIYILAVALQKFRYVISGCVGRDVPIIVKSGYRCENHNIEVYEKLDLKPNQESMHLHGLAADIRKIEGIKPAEMAKLAELVPDFQRGGIGVYDWGLHLDIRWINGKRKVRWDGR